MTVHGFWGLQVLPGKQYTQKVTLPFMITMASLTDTITSNKRCSLLINVDGEEFVLCSLTPEKLEQQVLSTTIMEGEEVIFSIKGDNAIHLTGNHVFDIADAENGTQHPEQILDQRRNATASLDSVDDENLASNTNNQQKRKLSAETDPQEQTKRFKEDNDLTSSDQHHESKCEKEQKKLQSYMNSLNGHVQQLQQQLSIFTDGDQHKSHKDTLKSSSIENGKIGQQSKAKGNEDQKGKKKMADKKKPDDDGKKNMNDKKQLDGKKETIGIKKSQSTSTSASASTSTSASTVTNRKLIVEENSTKLKVVRLPNGMVVEDKKMGTGRPAGTGSKVGMRYLGKLLNGKKFDSNTSGVPFRFILGKGTVIRGWDIGVAGMKVGGERRLVIPPSLAYRQRGMPPDIPPNSTLVFDVKLVELK